MILGVMEKMRKSTGVILWVLIFSFGVLWMLGTTNVFNKIGAGPRLLGSVNGEPISIKEFHQTVNNINTRYSQRTGNSASAEQRANFQQLAWNNLVNTKILTQKMNQLGIVVTDREVDSLIVGTHPAPLIRREFGKNGKLNREAIHTVFTTNQYHNIAIAMQEQLRRQRRRQKMADYIQAAMQVSPNEVNQQYIRNNTTANISYVRFPYSDIKKSDINVTTADLKNYYKKHPKKFHQDKSYRFKYVTFSKAPTKQDTARSIKELKKLRPKFAEASNDSLFIAQHLSTTPYNAGFMAKKDIRKLFHSALTKLDTGKVSPAMKKNGSVYIVKKEAQKGDSVKFSVLSHRIKADPIETVDKRNNEANDFRYFAKNNGFDKEAKRRKLTIHHGFATKGNTFIAGLGQSRQIMNMLKDAKKGSVSKSIELPAEFVVLKVTNVTPAGTRPFNQVKKQIKTTVIAQKRKSLTRKKVEGLLQKGNENLKALAKAAGKKVQTAKSVSMNDVNLPGSGREPVVIGAAFGLKKGIMSKPVEGTNAVYVLKVTERQDANPKKMSSKTADKIRRQLQQQKNAVFAQVWLKQLKARAKIVDNRSKLLRKS
jgi:peptidyl-prolyl cis-trans isomerase D